MVLILYTILVGVFAAGFYLGIITKKIIMEKINVAQLLKNCPEGMELDCTIWDSEAKVFLKRVLNDDFAYPIEVTVKYNNTECTKSFTKYGAFNDLSYCKCVIFPKGKTTWEGFVPPCQFKDGDVISDSLGTCIYKGEGVIPGTVDYYCGVHGDYFNVKRRLDGHYGNIDDYRFATKEEKAMLFQAIKDNGYKWNEDTKTLEKLIQPKFKVGDTIIPKDFQDKSRVINAILDNEYNLFGGGKIPFRDQDNWELVPNKFDITTLVPFKSRVLVRDTDRSLWKPAFWGFYINTYGIDGYYVSGGSKFNQCIPYEGNEHLLGKTGDCDKYFKTWK